MIIGITGSIASGKSLVTEYLKNKGYNIIDCDIISHQVLEFDEVFKQLVKYFGNEIISNNKIDRKILGNIVFNNIEKKHLLESIVFPYIKSEIIKQLNMYNNIVFLDAPLLIEYNLHPITDEIILVKTDKDIQINRLMERDNISYEYALKKINSQLSIEEKEKYATYVINNNLSIQDTYNQIENILNSLEEKYEN